MSAIINAGKLEIDIDWLLDSLDSESRLKFIESLSCTDSVIEHVTNQILDGWTENGFYGSMLVTASHEPTSGLDKAVRQVALRSGEVASKEIKRLENALKYANDSIAKLHEDMRNRRHGVES